MYLPGEEQEYVGWGNSTAAWNLIYLDAYHDDKSMKEGDLFSSLVIAQSWPDAREKLESLIRRFDRPPERLLSSFQGLMSYFSKSHTQMPSCPPLTRSRVGQITSHAKMGVTYWLQKIFGNAVMQSSQWQAFCGVALQFMERSDYSWPWFLLLHLRL